MFLTNAGLDVRTASDGAKAWDEVDWPPDIVVAELAMPGIDGVALCRRLREDPRTVDARILGLAKSTGRADYLLAVRTGFDLLLRQPCDPKTLLHEIARIRIRAASLRRRAELVVARAAATRSDAADVLSRSHSQRDRHELESSRREILSRIRSSYFELPGLKLTAAQGARLWALNVDQCAAVLESLVERNILVRRDGSFCLR